MDRPEVWPVSAKGRIGPNFNLTISIQQNQQASPLADLDSFDPVPKGEMPLDPGIRRYVLILRMEGIETFESCQGGAGHVFPEPTVRFYGNTWEGHKAFSVAMTYGLSVSSLRRYYDVTDGELNGPRWEMTFRTADWAEEVNDK